MKKDEVLEKLAKLGKDRAWLAAESGYEFMTVTNKLGPSGSVSVRMLDAFERVLMIEEAQQTHTKSSAAESAWDHVWFNGIETKRIMQAMVSGGYQKAEDLYHDAVIDFVDNLLTIDKTSNFEIPFHGYAAAGSPIVSQLNGETVCLAKKYPPGYFVIEVNGHSMEPTIPDGCRIVCEPKEYTPKHGKVCVISDGHGSSLKRYDGKRKAFVSDNPAFPDFTPVDEVKLQGYFVEVLPS
jgi:SOS-response transcriptional repressor LexA